MDLSKYRQLFLDESREHLHVMNRELLLLEQQGETAGVDALFRAAHSIKGMSGSMGYDAVVAVSHALEDILDRLRKKTLGVDAGLMTLLYEGVDSLGALVTEIDEKGTTHLEVAGLVARLRAAAQRESSDPEPPRPLETPATPAHHPPRPPPTPPPRYPEPRRSRPRTPARIWSPPGGGSSASTRRSSRWCAIS